MAEIFTLGAFMNIHIATGKIDSPTIRIQYLLSVQLNAAFQPTRLKFLLSFRRSLRLETKRGRQLDFDDETKGGGVGAMGRRCLK